MKSFAFSIPKGKQPKYQRLAEGLRMAIRKGLLEPGEKIPSTRDLAKSLRMHRHTVMAAIDELIAEGWISAEARKSYRVERTLPSTFFHANGERLRPAKAKRTEYLFARKLEINNSNPSPWDYQVSFPSGFPDLRLFPVRELKSHFYDALHAKRILAYGNPQGYEPLRAEISAYLRRMRSLTEREVIVTNGSQEAIFLLSQLFLQPGDAIAVEELGYPPGFAAMGYSGAKLISIPVDKEGLVTAHLREVLKQQRIKLLYITPLHQYPTTVTLSAARRLELYDLALEHRFFILEDDYDHEFHYRSQPVAPLASQDPAGLVFYVSTFSKILFPSARIGFMAVPPEIAGELGKLKRITSRQNEHILQDAIARWMREEGFDRHLRKMRRIYEERCNAMIADLLFWQKKFPKISWSDPDGGMALWLNLSEDSSRIAKLALAKSIQVIPEAYYRLDRRTGTHLRLGFTGQTPEENHNGLKKIFEAGLLKI